MLRNIRNTRRLLAIAFILAREDALFILQDLHIAPVIATLLKPLRKRKTGLRKGQRLAAALERLGPTFIKLGQTLSTRSDLIGDDVAEDLGDLRDRLPPFPTAFARRIIEEDIGAGVDALFASFSEAPVAAASIAQVHRATTKDGRELAVKILRPGIEDAFARDLDLFFWMAEIIEYRLREWRRFKPLEVVRTLKESVFFELDLRFEAAAATELAQNLEKHEPGFRVPKIDWNFTSRRVLCMEWVDGIPLNDIAAIRAAGHSPDMLLGKAARSLFAQVFYDGFFHADLHPGNLFVDKKGDIVAVDFGIMGRLDWDSRVFIAQILRGFIEQNYRHVAEVHFAAGYVPPDKSIEAFTQACMAVAQPIMGKPLNEISVGKLLGQMFRIAAEFEMETQPQLLLLQKTMVVTEGVGRMLNPKLNMWQLAEPLIHDWAGAHFGLGGKARDTLRQGGEMLKKLPQVMNYLEQSLKTMSDPAGLRLHPRTIETFNRARTIRERSWLRLGWTALIMLAALGLANALK
ncbi:MAG: 2-polyprenylphenol 6-hydroxylase [Rickettsiales bacterium]|nr:2-polyprenylphenol 6-hydroxylase [Rickettsiales bacterium]